VSTGHRPLLRWSERCQELVFRDDAVVVRVGRIEVRGDGGMCLRLSLGHFSRMADVQLVENDAQVRGLRVGRHKITVVARDRAGNRSVIRRHFGRCALALAAPQFTG